MSVLHCIRREDHLIFYAGGTAKSPKNRLVTVPIKGGLEALSEDDLQDVTPRQRAAIQAAVTKHRHDSARDQLRAVLASIDVAVNDMKGLSFSEDDYKTFASTVDTAKKKLKALVIRAPGESGPAADAAVQADPV
jgi:hypothetical protein